MKKNIFFITFLFFSIFLPSVSVFSQPAFEQAVSESAVEETAKVVKAIEVKGNKTISLATILSKIKTRVGQEYLQTVISDDLKRLYNTGFFSDVRVDRQDYEGGLKVVIYLDEKSVIEEVTFSKTRYLKSRALSKKIKSQVGKFLDNKSLADDIETIKDLYAKKGLTMVEVEPETFVDDVSNKATVHFVIREGHRVKITRINIYGNDTFRNKKILKVIKTRKKSLFTSGNLKEDVLKEDMERITSYYEQEGFIDAKAEYALDHLVKGRLAVNIQISEGKRYSVGRVKIGGNQVISEKEVLKAIESIKEGNVFSRAKLSVDLANIRTLYFDRGYIFADVKESTSLDSVTGNVEVSIDIVEGGLAYIEQIKIQGNTRTRDIVIRRELKMYPGDRFDGAKLRRSKDRLNNLGYFEDVSFDVEDTDTLDRKNLLVQIKEAKTGTFSFGGGFSTVDQIVGFIEVEQRNFDFTNWPTFTGGGQNLQLRAETGSTKNNLMLSFTEPWLFDYPISGGFDIFRMQRNRERDIGYAYDEEKIGGALRFGKQFSDYLSGGLTYRNERITIENLESGVSSDLASEEGSNTVSTLGTTLTRDTRDSVFSPTQGIVLNGGIDVAGGPLSGDKDFYRIQGRGSYYVPFKFNSVVEFRLRGGIVNDYGDSDKVPIFERFFAGGAKTIRGYNERKVGPLDSSTEDPIGGESLLVANVEYTVPIIEAVKLAAFLDTGNVWKDVDDFGSGDFKSGTGVGVRVKTPIGPINLDYGYPLSDEPGEESRSGKFYFSVSRGF
ncbi:MAG TPA: outer membrane protein assembly factor BamA [Candidatus Omnitrophica bacterium]|nr:MAG: outer membrane protein assembly factor BamA [Omnitrophica WOR_2 bacterium GWA2_45_18]HBR14884.1 outer membrane protein assembly factor BamA [Candidatus Omnitrophota bacterium]